MLYDDKVRDLILGLHGWEFVAERRHLVIKSSPPLEADVVIAARTPRQGRLRFIGVELKEHNFREVLGQGAIKSTIFNVVYVVTSSLYLGVKYTFDFLKQAMDSGVGIIYYRPDVCSRPILILSARLNKKPRWIEWGLGSFKLQKRLDGSVTVVYEGE